MKRLFDLIFSVLGLLVLTPVFLVIAVWIKFDSKGPVFFRQERVGLKGKHFFIFKFRTMITGAERKGLQITVGRDPRITSSGHFLRKSKLDELPQLINVLFGQMSLVGPRPEVPEYMMEYAVDIREQILSVRPGITDEASIEFSRESEILAKSDNPRQAYISEIMPVKAEYYVQYARHNSLLGDIKLILRTIKKILS